MMRIVSAEQIFVCEFITGGGLARPEGDLLVEGEGMRSALLRDLTALGGVRVVTVRAAGLAACRRPGVAEVMVGNHCWSTWRSVCAQTEWLWPIAPETDGALARLSALGKPGRVLGCIAHALRLTASKHATVRRLAARGIPVVPTFSARSVRVRELPRARGWVLKPDDGVGAEGLCLFQDRKALESRLRQAPGQILQPFISGQAASLTLLCAHGRCRLLAVNRQNIHGHQDGIRLGSLVVGGLNRYKRDLEPLARAVTAAVSGLWGLVGVDLILTRSGPRVLEINPRLTTAYIGLHASLGINPARLVLDLARGRPMPRHFPGGKAVLVDLCPTARRVPRGDLA